MQVIKRDGKHETISFDKITKRISDLCFGLEHVDPLLIAKDTINGIFDGIKTVDLDILSADICATKAHHHPEYNKLGGRILVSNVIKTTLEKYIDVVQQQYDAGIISEDFYKFVSTNEDEIQKMFDYQRDYLFDYFAIKTLERSYLFKINGKIVERPQHMWMRVAIQIHGLINQENQLSLLKETYDLLSTLYFTHATPTLFNSGTNKPQLSSCYLFSCEDNLEDIFKMISDVAKISKWAGGIGLSLSNIRAKGSMIKGTNGKSEGIIPLCKTLEMVGRYINQGGKRQGSIACYLEPFHPDIYAFIELRKNTGDENLRSRDLFLALWVPDLFMKRVQEDADWTLMCPDECKGLVDSYGEEFEQLYTSYEKANKGRKTVKARDLWNHILESQIETGMPYISYKDTVNRKSMQKHLGVIRNSNLCVAPETMILTKEGYYPIQSLENKEVKVWNGFEYSDTTIYKTGENQSLVTVTFSNGSSLDCTPYHKFYIDNGGINADLVKAEDLKKGMKLIDCKFPVITDCNENDEKKDVPILACHSVKLKWLEKLFDTIGFIDNNGYQLSSPDSTFIENVKYLLQTLGCNPHSKVSSFSSIYCLQVSNPDMLFLISLGFRTNLFKVSNIKSENNSKSVFVNSVTNNGRVSDTYCFTEHKRGMGIFNGVLTGQCNEIALFSNKDNYAVCFTGDTQILTENGYKCIKDCDNEKVLSYFDNDTSMVHKEQFISAKLIDNGEKDVYELKCTGTKPIKVTGNHLFAVYNGTIRNNKGVVKRNFEWKKAIELSYTDKILLPKTNVLPTYVIDNSVNEDYLTIGWMLGDGWQHKNKKHNTEIYGVCFGPTDIYARDRVIKKLNEWKDNCDVHKNGHKKTTEYTIDKRTGVYSWASSKQEFIKNIKDNFGLECKTAHYKIVPEKIKNSSPKEQASFLSGLFSADGSVYILDKTFYINLSSSSETLLYDVKNMLKCFGIDSRVVYSSVKNNTNTQGKLTIEKTDSINNYYKYINFELSLQKSEKLKYGLETIKKIDKYVEYCKLKSLTYIGKEKVYDLNVPNTHNFIAEGFVVHNCNLVSICLPRFVENGVFNFEKLQQVAGVATRNLNNVIDVNFYPTPETRKTNFANRPIGIGIQGQADVYCLLGLAYSSDEARLLSRRIFENIYYGSVQMSIQLAKEKGPYESYKDSPHSKGLLQFDLHDNVNLTLDWTDIKKEMALYGIRNSLLTALMPTASTSQIMSNNECFEPYTSNIYLRKTLAGEFTVVNQHLISDLQKLGLWNEKVYEEILYDNGSVQKVKSIPDHIKQIYKTAFELKMTDMLKQAVERGPFIDHMQSMNLFMAKPDFNLLNSSHFYSWKNGLKTGMYYLRTQPAVDAVKFGLDPNSILRIKDDRKQILKDAGVAEGACPRDPYLRAICESCSS